MNKESLKRQHQSVVLEHLCPREPLEYAYIKNKQSNKQKTQENWIPAFHIPLIFPIH